MAETTKLGLPLISGNMTWDVVRDANALAQAIDGKAGVAGGLATLGTNGKVPAGQLDVDTSGLATKQELTTHLVDITYQKAGGTATALTVDMQPLTDGYAKTFIASANNSGAATKINGKSLYKPGTTSAPTLIKEKAYTVWYSQSSDCFFIKASAEGTATTAQVLAGVPFSNEVDTGLIGTMPNLGSVGTQTLITQNQEYTIPAGYHNGAGKVKATYAQPVANSYIQLTNSGMLIGGAIRDTHNIVKGADYSPGGSPNAYLKSSDGRISLTVNNNISFNWGRIGFTTDTMVDLTNVSYLVCYFDLSMNAASDRSAQFNFGASTSKHSGNSYPFNAYGLYNLPGSAQNGTSMIRVMLVDVRSLTGSFYLCGCLAVYNSATSYMAVHGIQLVQNL